MWIFIQPHHWDHHACFWLKSWSLMGAQMCQGLNSHYFHIIGDGHQPNSRGLYTHEIRIPIKGGRSPIPNIATTLTMAQMASYRASLLPSCWISFRWNGDPTSSQIPWWHTFFVGFLRGVFNGGNWGTLRIPREDWATLGESPPPP